MIEKKVVLVVAYQGYQQIEYNDTKAALIAAKIKVITASDKAGYALAVNGSSAKVDVVLNHLKVEDYDGIFFIGGPGALEHLDNDLSHAILRKAALAKKLFGAICIATRILAYADILAGKKATGWNDDKQLATIYREYEVIYVPEPVVVDKNCITATDPKAAKDFGNVIVKALL
jgi:putative intracellular protease/amidase